MRAKVRAALTAVIVFGALAGCTVFPKPLESDERTRLAVTAHKKLFEDQEPVRGPISLAEAMARAIKYQAEYRQRQLEQAVAGAQLDVSQFDLLPKLTINAGYTTRDNDAFGFGFTQGGAVAANPSASTERTRQTVTSGFSWNVLDFGVSYYRARQLADQSLIAQERRRKALQTLMHDVHVAWWRAEAAERLLPRSEQLLNEIERAVDRTRVIESRKLLPPLQTATLRRALLDLAQQISFRRQELAQAQVELAALVNLPPGSVLRIAPPPEKARLVRDLTAEIDRLESLALQARPEMAEEGYRARISRDEARKALVGLLPGLNLDLGYNYDSNRFLVNNTWTSAGASVLFNLVKAFSYPAQERSAEAQQKADEARRLAMAMAVLTQTRLAAVRYRLVSDEFQVWDDAARDDDLIVGYLSSSAEVGIDTELELIRAKARSMASHMNRDLSFSNVQAAVARLYHSVGYDAVPRPDEARSVAELSERVASRLAALERASFAVRAEPVRPSAAVGEFTGAPAMVTALLREGVERVLGIAKIQVVEPASADLLLQFSVDLSEEKTGRRDARISVALVKQRGTPPGPTGGTFKTTLSVPVDDEQWRVLGEGAMYRVIEAFMPRRERHPALRSERALGALANGGAADRTQAPTIEEGAPLGLRLDEGEGVRARSRPDTEAASK